MNQEHIGKFISTLRKEKNLTQEELANILNVSNKTISRWENGICMPDLSLLQTIANYFNINISELLNGKRMTKEELMKLKNTIEKILEYQTKENKNKLEKILKYIKASILIISILSSVICLTCDYLINENLTWSYIATSSIIFSNIVIFPSLTTKKESILKYFLISLSLSIFPYLKALSIFIREPLIFRIGSTISITTLISLWLSYSLIYKTFKNKKEIGYGLSILTLILIEIGTKLTLSYFIETKTTYTDLFFNITLTTLIVIIYFMILKKKTRK